MGLLRFPHRRRGCQGDAPSPPSDTDLADEVEAFLTGRLADYYVHAARRVPSWTLLNCLAHGTVEQLAELLDAGYGWRVHPSLQLWRMAEQALARRLLAAGGTPGGLRRIQHATLVPVELRLAERSKTESLSPGEVLLAANAALDASSV